MDTSTIPLRIQTQCYPHYLTPSQPLLLNSNTIPDFSTPTLPPQFSKPTLTPILNPFTTPTTNFYNIKCNYILLPHNPITNPTILSQNQQSCHKPRNPITTPTSMLQTPYTYYIGTTIPLQTRSLTHNFINHGKPAKFTFHQCF